MCKKRYVYLVAFMIFFFLISSVHANFVCGTIQDTEEMSAAWMDVQLFYTENPTQKTECQVSPQENKFCCDPQEITTVNWAIGKEVNAKIMQGNFVTPQKSLTISGEGFDVFEDMPLQKVITLHSPNNTIYLNQSEIFVNLSTISEFNQIRYTLESLNNTIEQPICSNCTAAAFSIEEIPYGTHTLTIYAENANGDEAHTSWDFSHLAYLSFNRLIECPKCTDQLVLADSLVNVTVILNLSHNATGILSDYFPAQWQFLGDENIQEFGQSHGKVSWEVNGKDISKTYQIQAPSLFFPRRYHFRSEFGDYSSEKYRVGVRRFHSFLPINIDFIPESYPHIHSELYNLVSIDNPLVMNINHTNLVQVALFPNETISHVYGFVRTEDNVELSGAVFAFAIGSNFNDRLEETFIRFKVVKPSSSFFELESATLYHYNVETEEWDSIQTTQSDEDETYVFFESMTDQKGIFAIDAEIGLSFI